jgi:hypothetical protein
MLAVALATSAASYKPKYRITVSADKHTDFTRFKTYTWMDTHPANLPEINGQIVTAIDRELRALGITKATAGPGDVVATYASFTRTDVNVKAKEIAKDFRPEYAVGTLVVSLLEPASLRTLLKLRADKPVGPNGVEATIDTTVAAMFKRFPSRPK